MCCAIACDNVKEDYDEGVDYRRKTGGFFIVGEGKYCVLGILSRADVEEFVSASVW